MLKITTSNVLPVWFHSTAFSGWNKCQLPLTDISVDLVFIFMENFTTSMFLVLVYSISMGLNHQYLEYVELVVRHSGRMCTFKVIRTVFLASLVCWLFNQGFEWSFECCYWLAANV